MSKFFKPASSVFRRTEAQPTPLEDVRTGRPKPPGRRRKFGGSRMRDQLRSSAGEQQQTSDDSDKEQPSTSRPSRPTPSTSRSKAKSMAVPSTRSEPEGKTKKFRSTKESSNSNAQHMQRETEGVASVMENVAKGLIDRLPKIEQMEEVAVDLEDESKSFQRESSKLENKMKEQNRKMTKILMIVVGVGALIVVPVVIYLLVSHESHDK